MSETTTVKTENLTGRSLDYAVAKALGQKASITTWHEIISRLHPVEDADDIERHTANKTIRVYCGQKDSQRIPCPRYSEDWAASGSIIDREMKTHHMNLWGDPETEGQCVASYKRDADVTHLYGPTPLVAAMRCFVDHTIGPEIEIPTELAKKEEAKINKGMTP